jgi:hypothetical protein
MQWLLVVILLYGRGETITRDNVRLVVQTPSRESCETMMTEVVKYNRERGWSSIAHCFERPHGSGRHE